MSKVIHFRSEDIEPEKEIIFKDNGYLSNQNVPEKIQCLYEEALNTFRETSSPAGIISDISQMEFREVFIGERINSNETPIQNIYQKAENLSLFAVTLGKQVSDKIRELFRENDFALGHMLDCVASLSADNAVKKLEKFTTEDTEEHREKIITLAYSPGYCGWHISGQKKLFEFLQPEKIGIILNDSFLMIPLKSVSGILISGQKDIHRFRNNFSFCELCKTKSCLERM